MTADSEAKPELPPGKLTAKDTSKRADVEVRVDSTVQAKRQSANFSHPYYWAPFILIGNGL